jgi:hypothetical protein
VAQLACLQALFMYTFLGRALLLLFLGSVILDLADGLSVTVGVLSITYGFVYVLLHFASTLGAPEPIFGGPRDLLGRPIFVSSVATEGASGQAVAAEPTLTGTATARCVACAAAARAGG